MNFMSERWGVMQEITGSQGGEIKSRRTERKRDYARKTTQWIVEKAGERRNGGSHADGPDEWGRLATGVTIPGR